jgi:hypothetical protein
VCICVAAGVALQQAVQSATFRRRRVATDIYREGESERVQDVGCGTNPASGHYFRSQSAHRGWRGTQAWLGIQSGHPGSPSSGATREHAAEVETSARSDDTQSAMSQCGFVSGRRRPLSSGRPTVLSAWTTTSGRRSRLRRYCCSYCWRSSESRRRSIAVQSTTRCHASRGAINGRACPRAIVHTSDKRSRPAHGNNSNCPQLGWMDLPDEADKTLSSGRPDKSLIAFVWAELT